MPAPGALLALALAGAAPADCAALADRALNAGRVISTAVEDGACRVRAELTPVPGSRIGLELWLPLSGWSGRYVQLGTGGFAGTIPRDGLLAEVRRGNAAAATNTGHVGRDGFDASWAAGRPQAVVDYGYRAVKVSSDAGRALTAAFYGEAPRHRYFVGCSNGGRQGLMAAQRNPEDWDGVLAGAPAVRWTQQLSAFARIQQALRRPGGMIPASKLGEVAAGRARLTSPQAAALAEIARVFDPRWAAVPEGWNRWIVNPDRTAQTQLTFAEQFFGNMVLNRPDWRVEALTADDLAHAAALAPVLDADGSLAAFRARGGKLIIYHGLADPVTSPRYVADYHRREGAADFSRLYLVPGMLHCQGGTAPDAFGQSYVSPPASPDPAHDVRKALELWVETGRPPGDITAVKYVAEDPARGIAARGVLKPAD